MSFLFEPFRHNWLQYSDLFDRFASTLTFTMDLDESFFCGLKFDSDSLLHYRISAARSAASQLGDNPVLCLSGGIDSQAMIQAWVEAGIKFDTAIGVFNNGLNAQDSDHALMFCREVGIDPIIVDIDVVNFLTRDNRMYGEKYRCTSPHFITHYKMFDMLQDMGYTGICTGGNAFAKGADGWGPAPSPAQMNHVEYSRLNEFPVIGNFLGYDPELCWTIALLTPMHPTVWLNSVDPSAHQLALSREVRYSTKIEGYQNHGFNIIPQDKKYTGFELVKDYFAEKFNDGWTFEKKFRHPLEKMFGNAAGKLVFTDEQLNMVEKLYHQNGFSS